VEDVVDLAAEGARTRPLPELAEGEPQPMAVGSERLSPWFPAALVAVQLGWLGAIAYLLVRIFG
jgi:hypothetical protein